MQETRINFMTETPAQAEPRATASTPAGLNLVIFESFDRLAVVRDEWDKVVARFGGDIYFTFDWLETWWKHYGADRSLRCFLIRQGERPIAALPFLVETFGFGPARVRVARFVGANSTIPVFSPAIEPGHDEEVLRLVFDDLFGRRHCDAVSLSPLSDLCSLATSAVAICAVEDDYAIARNDSVAPHTVFTLPASFDEYFSALAKQTRSNYRRDMRNLDQVGELAHHVLKGEDASGRFSDFVALHGQQWREVGKSGHFGDWPDSLSFNRVLVERFARRGQVRLYELMFENETLSLQFGFLLGDRFFWRLPARRVGERWDKAGIGRAGAGYDDRGAHARKCPIHRSRAGSL